MPNIHGKERFRRTTHQVIVNSITKKMGKFSTPPLRLQWRLGYNLFGCGRYFECFKYLEAVASAIEATTDSAAQKVIKSDFLDKISQVYLMAGRCCYQMFIQTGKHYHLESAYHKYDRSIKSLPIDFLTAIRLPVRLYEFCRILEAYGSFESALKTYGKILSAFPNYKGYFDAMYRSTLVGKFLATQMKDIIKQQEIIRQCIDMLQFLLEAVPPSMNEVHVLFLYCMTLETSSEAAYRFQIGDAFKALHKLCRTVKPPMLSADLYRDYREWLQADPYLWYNMGQYFLLDGETLLARDAFALFIKRANATNEVLSVDVLLSLAKNSAQFQNYDEAVKYADEALAVNRFDKETRSLLAQWSEIRKAELELEENSVATIAKVWKGRLWQPGYRKKYSKIVVKDLETTMSMNTTQYNSNVRNELAYFGRDKWRARFLFEDECARRIQRSFRGAKLVLSMQRAGREKYRLLANEICSKLMKKPFDFNLRREAYRIEAHRFCPRVHAIHSLTAIMKNQEVAHWTIRKNVNIWRLKNRLRDAVKMAQYKEQLKYAYAAINIQAVMRMRRAIMRSKAMMQIKRKRNDAATVIQRFIRHRNQSVRQSAKRLVLKEKWRRDKATNMVVIYLIGVIKRRRRVKIRFRLERNSATKIQRTFRKWKKKRILEREFRRKVFTIQQFMRGNTNRITQKLALNLIRKRRKVTLSNFSSRLMHSPQQGTTDIAYAKYIQDYGAAIGNNYPEVFDLKYTAETCLFRNPGVRQGTAKFDALLEQRIVVCTDLAGFSVSDCMLLCSVLRHPLCRIMRVIFQNIDGRHSTFEFDLVQAVGKCISLRSLVIIGGIWRSQFLCGALESIQKLNPRVNEVVIEDLRHCIFTPSELSSIGISGGKLVGDFFNYSVPGIRTLSLHGIGLRDAHISELASGLSVNSSLSTLILSSNVMEDFGLTTIINAISNNRRCVITVIDFSWNLVTGISAALQKALKKYKNSIFGMQLCLLLHNNHIRFPIDVGAQFRQDLHIFYELEDIYQPKQMPKIKHTQTASSINDSSSSFTLMRHGVSVNAKGSVKFTSKQKSVVSRSQTIPSLL